MDSSLFTDARTCPARAATPRACVGNICFGMDVYRSRDLAELFSKIRPCRGVEAYRNRDWLGSAPASERRGPARMSGSSPDELSYPIVKRLLDNYGEVWWFEIREGQKTTYSVERDERCWTFNLPSSA